jgi:hypothetical protein
VCTYFTCSGNRELLCCFAQHYSSAQAMQTLCSPCMHVVWLIWAVVQFYTVLNRSAKYAVARQPPAWRV